MTKRRITPCLIALSLCLGLLPATAASAAAASKEIGGASFATSVRADNGEALTLSGVGLLRYRVLFKGYAAGLYFAEGSTDKDPFRPDVARRLEIEYFWSIRAEDFARVTIEGLERNVDAVVFESLRATVDRFNAFYRDVRPGDRYALTYLPGVGTELALNGERLGLIEGEDFASALFAIWFGEDPADAGLKRELLGKS